MSSGCGVLLTAPAPSDPQALLRAVETGPESLTLEIFQVRIPCNDPNLAEKMWSAVDEQRLPLETRRGLVRNGFRAGVLSGAVPDLLAEHMKLDSPTSAVTSHRKINDQNASPSVVRRVLQLNRQEQATIQTSELRDHLNVLVNHGNGVEGQTFREVQPAYSLRAESAPGQRVSLQLTPELQHGELRNRYAGGDQGIFLVTPSRERRVYDELTLNTELAAGELLLVGCLPDAPTSLGHAFHGVDLPGPAQQKLVLVRLIQIPPSEILADARGPGR